MAFMLALKSRMVGVGLVSAAKITLDNRHRTADSKITRIRSIHHPRKELGGVDRFPRTTASMVAVLL